MNIYKLLPQFLGAMVLMLATARSDAHDVWIEDTPAHQLIIRFGEFDDELETSPGYLDSLTAPAAWTKGKEGDPVAFSVQKGTNSFLLVGASITNMAAAEADFEVLSATNKPARLPIFNARWQPAEAGPGVPTLTFDLVPQEKPGDVRVFFRGKPVADQKVTVSGPNGYEEDQKTDANGNVHFNLTVPGFYLFTSNHYRETRFGYAGGRPYDLVSYNASLTLRLPKSN